MQSQTRTAQTLLRKGSSKEVRYLEWPGPPCRVWLCCPCRPGRRQCLQHSTAYCVIYCGVFMQLCSIVPQMTQNRPRVGGRWPPQNTSSPQGNQSRKCIAYVLNYFPFLNGSWKRLEKISGQSWKDNYILWHNSWHLAAGSKAQPRAHLLRHRNGKPADSLNAWFTLSANTSYLH